MTTNGQLCEAMNTGPDVENLLLILKGWRDSSSLIKLRLDISFSIELWIHVKEVSPTGVLLSVVGPDDIGKVEFDPRGCTFRYQDPREADESVKLDAESKVICALSVLFPDGANLLLYERRTEDDEG